MNAEQIGMQLHALLKENGYTIRPYEGERSCCIIENEGGDSFCLYDADRHGDMLEPMHEESDPLLKQIFIKDYILGSLPKRSELVTQCLNKLDTAGKGGLQYELQV